MTNDDNKIHEAMTALRQFAADARQAWVYRDRTSGNWSATRDAIAKLSDQCNLLLSPEYLGDEPEPHRSAVAPFCVTLGQVWEVARNPLDSIGEELLRKVLSHPNLRVSDYGDEPSSGSPEQLARSIAEQAMQSNGDEPQPLTADQLKDIAQQLDGEAACIGADVFSDKLDSARLRVECLRDELNKLNLPKASE